MSTGREVAVAEALDAEDRHAGLLLLPGQELLRAEAVADGPDADAHGVHRHLEERVEGDDLVHLAAADVHVVGERVRELGRQRADLAADAAEVVEEPRPLLRELREELGEPEDVYALIIFRRPWRDRAHRLLFTFGTKSPTVRPVRGCPARR